MNKYLLVHLWYGIGISTYKNCELTNVIWKICHSHVSPFATIKYLVKSSYKSYFYSILFRHFDQCWHRTYETYFLCWNSYWYFIVNLLKQFCPVAPLRSSIIKISAEINRVVKIKTLRHSIWYYFNSKVAIHLYQHKNYIYLKVLMIFKCLFFINGFSEWKVVVKNV